MLILANYINGSFVEPLSGKWLDNFEPAKGIVYGKIPDSNRDDVELAVQAAQQAFPAWAATPATERAAMLFKVAGLIRRDHRMLAELESRDNGKPVTLASTVDIPRAWQNIEFFAQAATQFASEAHRMEEGFINYTLRLPVGIVGCISPWNLPLYLFTWKIAPALAAGNCVLAKPSEVTPATAFALCKLFEEAGFPKGVFNVIHGSGASAGAALCSHPAIKAISFTGGTKTGADIARTAAPAFKKLSLELGGKNPVLVFDDCDFDQAVKTSIRSAFSNQGQICLCGSRIYVQESIYKKFKDAFVAKAAAMVPSDPSNPESKTGAIVSAAHFNKVLSYIDLAVQEGGTILCGGKAWKGTHENEQGWFIEPTVIEGLANNCRTIQEEIFGPVVTLVPFKDEAHALALANESGYGLAAVIWTNGLHRAHRLAQQLEAGIVWINCWLVRDLRTPFGGVKSSGVGREGGFEALRFFTEPKNICFPVH